MPVPNLATLATLTFRNQQKDIVDSIYNEFSLLAKMKETNSLEFRDGGITIDVPLRYVKDDTAQSFDGADQVDISPVETISNASYPWKNLHVPINLVDTDVAKNRGQFKIADLIEAKRQGAIQDGQDKLTEVLFADGTGNGGKDPMGLKGLFPVDPTTGTVGGINRATQTFWRSKANADLDSSINGAKTSTSVFAWADVGKRFMRNQMNNCAKGGNTRASRPNLIIMTQALYEQIANTMDDKVRIPDKALMDLAIESFMFMGVPCVWDAGLTTETIGSTTGTSRAIFVNTNTTKLVRMQGFDWKFKPFESPLDQYVSVASFHWMGNLVTKDSRRNGVISGFTTSL